MYHTARERIATIMVAVLFSMAATVAGQAQPVATDQTGMPLQPQIETSQVLDESISIFAGRFHEGFFGHSFTLQAPFEDNYMVAAAYQKFYVFDAKGWDFGLEVGLAGRMGESQSAEVWAGGVGRYQGWVLGDTIRVAPAITLGLSAVTDTIGVEKEREGRQPLSANLLFYLAPELSFSHVDNPEFEVFWRAHHRSGAWGVTGLAAIDGANAVTAGLRFKF